jgi:hypothetical protein
MRLDESNRRPACARRSSAPAFRVAFTKNKQPEQFPVPAFAFWHLNFSYQLFSYQLSEFQLWPWWPSARTQSTMLEPGMDQSL